MVIIAAVTSESFPGEIKKPRPLIVRSKDGAKMLRGTTFFRRVDALPQMSVKQRLCG